jgi:hypothetical protein
MLANEGGRAMPNVLSKSSLCTELKNKTAALGLHLRDDAADSLTGEMESIAAKWWLGGRKVTYRMSCKLTESDQIVHLREVVSERSWGIPPPTLTVEKTTVTGWKRSGERTDIAPGGGGSLNYAQVREAVELATAAAGWTFHLEGGRLP